MLKHSTKSGKLSDKARKNKNALVHGLYARDVLLPWEAREDFENLHAELREEFRPEGRMEEETVFSLAHLQWQRHRVEKMFHAAAHDDPFVVDLIRSGKKSWAGIRNHLRSEAKHSRTITGSVHNFLTQLIGEARELAPNLINHELKNAEIEKIEKQLGAIIKLISDRILPLTQTLEQGPSAEQTLRVAYSPQYLEPIIRLVASIDARIDKMLGRLASLKAYKRIEATAPQPHPKLAGNSPLASNP